MEPGLRERKKRQTRAAIADAALQLFLERGFDNVTVAEVARVADVSEATVFNYFPTKEDLVYERMEAFEDELLAAVRDRPESESVLRAFVRFVVERAERAGATRDARARVAALARLVRESPALTAREREVVATYTESLAALLAAETGAGADDIEPRVVAEALMGVHRSLIAFARSRSRSRTSGASLAEEVRAEAERAVALLEVGLRDYGIRPRSATGRQGPARAQGRSASP